MARHLSRILFVILIIVAGLWVGRLVAESEFAQAIVAEYGYGGILVLSILSGFNLLVPLPAVALLPIFTSSGLSLGTTIFVIAVGMTIGDALGFVIGRESRHILKSKAAPIVSKLEKWRLRHKAAPLLIMFLWASFVPLPNEVLVIPLAFLGYRFLKIISVAFLGNVVFNSLSALGIASLFEIV